MNLVTSIRNVGKPMIVSTSRVESETSLSLLYECIFMGLDPFEEAWPRGHREFAIDQQLQISSIQGQAVGHIGEYQQVGQVNWKKF
jgi:hypothetical protein